MCEANGQREGAEIEVAISLERSAHGQHCDVDRAQLAFAEERTPSQVAPTQTRLQNDQRRHEVKQNGSRRSHKSGDAYRGKTR